MKNYRRSLLTLAIILGPIVALPAHSTAQYGTWGFLKGTPSELFSKEDWSLFNNAVNSSLNSTEPGSGNSWENPNTGASGEISVLQAGKYRGKDCKRLQITSQVKDRKRTTTPLFCKQADGQWKLTSTTQKAKK